MSAARTSNLCGEVDRGGWDEEKERRGMGYSESISAHTVITTTDNRGHYVYKECMHNESAVCMSHDWFVDVICVVCDVYTPMHTGQRRAHGHAQRVCMWNARSNGLAYMCKYNARGMGNACAGK